MQHVYWILYSLTISAKDTKSEVRSKRKHIIKVEPINGFIDPMKHYAQKMERFY